MGLINTVCKQICGHILGNVPVLFYKRVFYIKGMYCMSLQYTKKCRQVKFSLGMHNIISAISNIG